MATQARLTMGNPSANIKNRPLPPKSGWCWYITDLQAHSTNWTYCVQLETDEYFRVISHYDGIVEGYLGRTNDEDLFFRNHRRGLAYFNDYQDRKSVYFTFDGIEHYRLNSILPGSPMRFVLKKINLATME